MNILKTLNLDWLNFNKKTPIQIDKIDKISKTNQVPKGTTPKDLREMYQKTSVQFKDIQELESFKEQESIHILIADDNYGAVQLTKYELDVIFGLEEIDQNNTFSKERIQVQKIVQEKIKEHNTSVEINTISGEYGLYSILKNLEHSDYQHRIDFIILDIIFGGTVIINGIPELLNGAELAKLLIIKYPDIKIILFTGCDLDSHDEIKNYIYTELGVDFLEKNIIIKSPDFCSRLMIYTTKINEVLDAKYKES